MFVFLLLLLSAQDSELPEIAVRQGHHGCRQAGARRGSSEGGMYISIYASQVDMYENFI